MTCYRFCIFIFLLFGISCKSWGGLQLLDKGSKVRIYAVRAENYLTGKNSDLLPKAKAFPILNIEQMKALLSNLSFYNYNAFSSKPYDVFHEEDVNYLAPRILRAMKRTKSGKGLAIVYKDALSSNLVRTTFRSTMLLWNDKQGLNIFLGEIQKPLLSEGLIYQYPGWNKTEVLDIDKPQEGIRLVTSHPYSRKQLNQLEQNTWLLLSPSNINSFLPKRKEKKKEAEAEGKKKQKTHRESSI